MIARLLAPLLALAVASSACPVRPVSRHHNSNPFGGTSNAQTPSDLRSDALTTAYERLEAFADAGGGGKGPACRPATQYGEAGKFSLIVFQQCWAAGWCNAEHTSGCTVPTDWMRNHLIVHGVWPTFDALRDGHVGPQCCDSPFGPHLPAADIASQRDELERNWPGMGTHPKPTPPPSPQSSPRSRANPRGLWEHEWAKHGTCSGKSQTHYFGTSLALQRGLPTPQVLRDAIGQTIDSETLLRAYMPNATADGDDGGADSNAEAHGNRKMAGAYRMDDDTQRWVGFECHTPRVRERHTDATADAANGADGVQELVHVTTCWSRNEQQRVQCPDWILHAQRNVRCVDGPVHIPVFALSD